MTSLLSAISGHFNRALIFGTVVPVLMFTVVVARLLEWWLPFDPPWRVLGAYGTEWQAVTAFLVVALASGVLHSVNVPLTRLYEGYPWARSFVGARRTARYVNEHRVLSARWRGYRTLRYGIEDQAVAAALGVTATVQADLSSEHSRIGRVLMERFPTQSLILPTRLGNAIRAFEVYPQEQYGISAITMWPRLIAVIDKDYAAAIAEQKASFDFMLNASALSVLSAAMLAVIGVMFPLPFVAVSWLVQWLLQLVVLIGLAYWFYEGAVSRAIAWGHMVRGAFDLFRLDLLRKLGFAQLPATVRDERRLWRLLSQQIIFGDTRRVRVPPFAAGSTFPEAEPSWLALTVNRSVEVPSADGRQRVHVRVSNNDPSGRAASRVVVVEQLSPGTELVYDSVAPRVSVEGVNPLRIPLGALAHGATAAVRFEITRSKEK